MMDDKTRSETKIILSILKSCDVIRELDSEFSKPFGWLKIKQKSEYKKLKNQVIENIDQLKNHTWSIDYLLGMQRLLLSYKLNLEDYLEEIYFSDLGDDFISKFRSMYFSDIVNDRERIITLNIESDNIVFTVFDITTGKSLELLSSRETSREQKKIEMICKQKIINMLKRYIEDEYKKDIDTKDYLKEYSNNSKN